LSALRLFIGQVIAVNNVGLIADEIVRNDSPEPVGADWRDAGHIFSDRTMEGERTLCIALTWCLGPMESMANDPKW
jgi:hypothetical protein